MVTLKASTLIETIIAMTILIIVITVSFSSLGILIQSSQEVKNQKARHSVELIARQSIEQELFVDEIIDSLDFMVEKKLSPFQNYQGLYLFEITAFDQLKTFAIHREIIEIK